MLAIVNIPFGVSSVFGNAFRLSLIYDFLLIIDYPLSTQGFDALSMSLYELVIEGIKNDGFDIGELVSDAVE